MTLPEENPLSIGSLRAPVWELRVSPDESRADNASANDHGEGTVRVRSTVSPHGWQELRLTVNGGGPGGLEFLVKADKDGTAVAAWNPYRHEWATQTLTGQGDSRRVGVD